MSDCWLIPAQGGDTVARLKPTTVDWYALADACVIFLAVYGLAKVCELALLAASKWRRMVAVFVIFGLTGVLVVEGTAAQNRIRDLVLQAYAEHRAGAERD